MDSVAWRRMLGFSLDRRSELSSVVSGEVSSVRLLSTAAHPEYTRTNLVTATAPL